MILTVVAAASLASAAAPEARLGTRQTSLVRAGADGKLVRHVIVRSAGFAPRSAAPVNGSVREMAESIAKRHNVEPVLVDSVIRAESNYNPKAVSYKGAQGLMQLMPATARQYGVADAFDPAQNIDAGVKHLRYLLDLYRGDMTLALAAYNAGEGAVARYKGVPPYRETQGYVEKIGRRVADSRPRPITRAAAEQTPRGPVIVKSVDENGREFYTAR